MISSFEISNTSIESVINRNTLLQMDFYEGFEFVRALGLSNTTLYKMLVVYGDLNPFDVSQNSINDSLVVIQKKLGLRTDGIIGPCTSLMLAAVAFRYFPKETKTELTRSLYVEDLWYLSSLQTCHDDDKETVKYALSYIDHPFNYEILQITKLLGSHKNHIINLLDPKAVDINAYHVLDIIKGRYKNSEFIQEQSQHTSPTPSGVIIDEYQVEGNSTIK